MLIDDKEKKSKYVMVAVTEYEKQLWKDVAEEQHRSVSGFVRHVIQQYLKQNNKTI